MKTFKDYLEEQDWGSMSKRQFKHAEMEHELGHETQAPSKHQSPTRRYYHDVPYAKKEVAKSHGMKWDGQKKSWYHTSLSASLMSKKEFPLK